MGERFRRFPGFPPPIFSEECVLAVLLPACKSKCWTSSDVRVCCKAGHSCWRRVLDFSRSPCPRGWRTIARAIRGFVANLNPPIEVADLCATGAVFTNMRADAVREIPCDCLWCGKPLFGTVSVVTMDIDQVFEKGCSATVLAARGRLAGRFCRFQSLIDVGPKRPKIFYTTRACVWPRVVAH